MRKNRSSSAFLLLHITKKILNIRHIIKICYHANSVNLCFKHKKHSLAYHSIHTCCFYVTGGDKSPLSHPPHAVSVCFSVANVPWLFSHFVISLCFELTLISIYLLGKSAANYIWLRDSLEFPASIIQVQACVASAVTLDLCCMTDAYPQGLPMLASTSCQDTGRKT